MQQETVFTNQRFHMHRHYQSDASAWRMCHLNLLLNY